MSYSPEKLEAMIARLDGWNAADEAADMLRFAAQMEREVRRCVGSFEQFAGKSASSCDPADMHLVLCEAHNALETVLGAAL